MTPDLQRKYAEWASRQKPRNEFVALARTWDIFGFACLLFFLFVVFSLT